jgi:hypothetical protein
MSLSSIIYHDPRGFAKYLTAYTMPQRRRGIVFASLMGFDISQALLVTQLDAMTKRIIEAINDHDTPLPSWVPTYTFGYTTPFSESRLPKGELTATMPPSRGTPRVISSSPRRCGVDAMAAACADGSPMTVISIRPSPKAFIIPNQTICDVIVILSA